jgi:hypothetical protein
MEEYFEIMNVVPLLDQLVELAATVAVASLPFLLLVSFYLFAFQA